MAGRISMPCHRQCLTVVGYAKNLVQLQAVTNRKLFGTNTLVNHFIKTLTAIDIFNGGRTTKYIDNSTEYQWLKYVVDERGFFVNLIFNSPPITTDELIEITQ